FMALAAGGLNGVVFLLGALVFEGDAEPGIAVVGGVFGVFHAIPFLPPLFWLDWAVESSFVTRPRTLAARRAKLEVAIALLTSVAFAWLFATHAVDRPLRAPALSLVTTLASLGGLVLLGVELVFLLRLRKTVRAWRDASPCSEEEIASRPPVDQPPVDLGVGEGWRRVVEEASLPYRDQARVVTAFQGDAEAAWSVAKQRTWVHGFVWLAALLSLASLGRGGLLRALF
ncbi:MAG: hypothetical protein KC731_06320, partial [Myxococcales bacterium]|nr:hypothetical protein [Myxococcales bacterium]